jgi:pyruvate/2-oxoglutarate dehydrogenase complex dihydrolipoamide dehydrogenase (E3) component
MERFDAVVIGSGQGGTPLARALAAAGRKTALIERKHLGGTCVNEGCTPTKTMIAGGRVAYLARRAADYGVRVPGPSVDMARVRQRKRGIVELFRGGLQKSLGSQKGLELVEGDAAFTGAKELVVRLNAGGARRLRAEQVFINAGCRPAVPPLEGLRSVPFLDSASIMELDQVPAHLLVLGGGYVGLEFAQLFRRLGSEVTIIQRGGRLLAREDADVCGAVKEILEQDGVRVLLDATATRVEKIAAGVRLSLDGTRLEGSRLLVAVGRSPNTETLGLAEAGVRTDERGFIAVDDTLETSVPGVFALGDVKGGPAFTHISYDDFRVLRTNLLEGGDASIKGRLVPYTVYLDPQLGRVGMTEARARAEGRRVRVAKMPMSAVARALETGETRGFIKAVVDADTGLILGAAALGLEGGEIMAQLQVAMMGGLKCTALRDAVFSHPSLAEALNNLFDRYLED